MIFPSNYLIFLFPERIPARYVLTLLTFLGLGIQYTQRVNLNVTMVAMVNTSFIEGKENDTTLDECPNPFVNLDANATSPARGHTEVKYSSAAQGQKTFHQLTTCNRYTVTWK